MVEIFRERRPAQITDFNPPARDFPDQLTLQELFEAHGLLPARH